MIPMLTLKHALLTLAIITTGAMVADHMKPETIDKRTAPIGKVKVKKTSDAATAEAAGPRTIKSIVDTYCMACHGTGMPGAAKIGDKEAWAAKLEKGKDAVMANAIAGINAMPAKGMCMDCTDDELWASIEYMANFEK